MELLEKLRHLEENIKILGEIRESTSLSDIYQNKRIEWEVRYGLFESIQIVIDISCKVASEYNLGNPQTYKECVNLLEQHRYLSPELSSRIIAMVGLRNILVHEYVEIDMEKLYGYLEHLHDFTLFTKEMTQQLR